jgi:D-glycero-D-manno-heptose 1,7-bisphosphate phosphatase
VRPAVFLDRDDTLIVNRSVTANTRYPGSLFDPELVRLLPGAKEGCAALKRAGFALVVVTNQGCVARGECTMREVEATNMRMRELLRAGEGAELDGVYVCPFHPKGSVAPWNVEHEWRKPRPGMVLAGASELELDISCSWMIGDAERDMEAAIAAGIDVNRTVMVGDAPARTFGHRVDGMVDAAARVLRASAG